MSLVDHNSPDGFGRYIREWYTEQGLPKLKVLSLFSGGGGLDIAFHDAGFEVVEMVEKDLSCVQTLNHNAQQGKLLEGSRGICVDVTTYEPNPDTDVDFIIGGPPCQSFSAAGRRMAGAMGTASPGGQLFQHYVRLLKMLQPRGFLFENVLGLLSAQQGSAWRAMREAFNEAGYQTSVHVLDAADYGVPQHRERVIVIGVKQGDFCFPAPTHGPRSKSRVEHITAAKALESVPADDLLPPPTGKYGHLLNDIPPGLNYSFYTERLGHPQPIFSWRSKFSDFLYKADPQEPTRTIKANGGPFCGPFHWEGRPFTLAELKRLQTFPDSYELLGGRRVAFRQLGNAVPPQLGRVLALAIRQQLFGEPIPTALDYLPHGDDTRVYRPKHLKTAIYSRKASDGHAAITPIMRASITEWEGQRFLTESFSWQSEPEFGSHAYTVKAKLGEDIWVIRLKRSGMSGMQRIQYTLTLRPNTAQGWPLEAKEVRIQACDNSAPMFTACWKAFEEILREKAHLSDLVQLSGYYYYTQRFNVELRQQDKALAPSWFAVAKQVSAGKGVGVLMNEDELAKHWGISPSGVPNNLVALRKLGFEVRSHYINPQIPVGQYLVPYSFPTLSPSSPLRKKEFTGLAAVTQ
ncbi:DNA cytosine methyltransferase [Hymenobacter sp. HSC-4F20]|uniref:DNA cytosine methyltransferase n=1 Tax=Hymenobacter sp. HSC-4F20 TaxID=2864135 RepID=UPI001C73C72C|nr:DNA cytosine methyltransferase [Hymenobacter sp. HSC-4F20]